MPRIMADHNVEGHLQVLLTIWSSPAWDDVWRGMGCDLESFERSGIAPDTSDTRLWELCQTQPIELRQSGEMHQPGISDPSARKLDGVGPDIQVFP